MIDRQFTTRRSEPPALGLLSLIVLLTLASIQTRLRADESRFNPPLLCGFLGIRASVESDGLRVDEVVRNSPAERGGLEPGDLIVRFAGKEGFGAGGLDVAAFARLLRSLPAGHRYTVEVLRTEGRKRIQVEPDAALLRDAQELARKLQNHRYFRGLKDRRERLDRLDEDLERAVRASSRCQEAYEKLNAVLDRLDVSHLAIIPPWVHESVFGGVAWRRRPGRSATPEPKPHLGLFLERVELEGEDRYFVHSQMNGSAPQRAGLRVGDEVTAINDLPFARSPRRTLAGYEARHAMYTIQIDARERIRLRYRRRAHGAETEIPLEADEPVSAVRSSELSVRRIDRGDDDGLDTLGYVHLWNVVNSAITKVFSTALSGELRGTRGLLVDLRGRGGSSAVLEAIARHLLADGRPAVLLLDRKSRSAKEVLAFKLKGKPGVRLVGERTAGAVRPATYALLPSGTALMIPVPNAGDVVQLTDGVDLESIGVEPDVGVECDLPFSSGRDPILERGIEVLRELVAELPAPRRRRL